MADLPDKLALEIVTPERRVLAESVDEVVLPGAEGYLGVRPGHAPLLVQLGIGQLECRTPQQRWLMAISGGFAEVQRERVVVLAETCEPADEIDEERCKKARERAEAELKTELSEVEFRRAEVALRRAVNRIQTHDRGRSMMA